LEELSIWHWNEANKTGDLKHIAKEGEPSTQQLNEAWIMLNNEHLSRYGISDLYDKILKKKIQICKEQIKFIKTDDRIILNSINLGKSELERLEAEQKETDLYNIIATLDKEFNMMIDPKSISVVKFHSYINLIKEKHERQD
jgi:hypothetical protein